MDAVVIYPSALQVEATALADALRHAGVAVETENIEPRPMAGLEDYLPTIAVLYLSRKYFDTMMSEAAKEHYPIIKAALRALLKRVAGAGRDFRAHRIVARQSPQKAEPGESNTFSVYAEAASGRRIKFLVPFALPIEEHDAAVDALHDLLVDHYARAPHDELSLAIDTDSRAPTWTFLLVYEPSERKWRRYITGAV